MPVAKKRKVTTATTKNAFASRSITSFAKVSKAHAPSKSIYEKANHAVASVPTSAVTIEVDADKKRKSVSVEEIAIDPEGDRDALNILSAAIVPTQRAIRPLPQRNSNDSQRLPQTPRKPVSLGPSLTPADTPTKGARSLLDRLYLSKKPSCSSLQFEKSTTGTETPQPCTSSEQDSKAADNELPKELIDLVHLHSAFLTALSLHYAHNGTHTPADLRILCPDVARAWGKRRVSLDDIRRTLGILHTAATNISIPAALSLSDYGNGKICVEVRTEGGILGRMGKPLDENRLNDTFTKNLKTLWEKRTDSTTAITSFIATLPLTPILICSSLTKMSPLLAKGQRRLEDMRTVITARSESNAQSKVAHAAPDGSTAERKLSLLERLRAKQQHQATLPPPPTRAEVERISGLHRLEEVVAVLTLLTTSTSVGQQRVSFTLATVLGKLKDSFKTPMSRDEGETCVRLLAKEIAPEWLKVMKMGKGEAVVVDRSCRPTDLDLQERVKKAL